jgi:hypothetical protein
VSDIATVDVDDDNAADKENELETTTWESAFFLPAQDSKHGPEKNQYVSIIPKDLLGSCVPLEHILMNAVTKNSKKPDQDQDQNESSASIDEDRVILSAHPTFEKYFKMLKMHVPKPAVQHRMKKDGVNPAALDLDPNAPYGTVKAELQKSIDLKECAQKLPQMSFPSNVVEEEEGKGLIQNGSSKLESATLKGHIRTRRFVLKLKPRFGIIIISRFCINRLHKYP